MMTSDDMTLVREFAASRSEPAFATLVERYVGLVHSAALRQAGDPDLAAEIAQAVFILLARKAAALGPKTILPAWLYRATRYAAADALRARRRRVAREQEAHMQSTLNEPPDAAWRQLAPLLDDALAQLAETDRTAVVLRYFENKSAREIAAALQMGEAAAQKRITRGLEKLRVIFAKHGVALTTTVIAAAVAANAVQAAPAGLALAAKSAALTAAGTGTFGLLQFMTMIKLKLVAGALLAAGVTTTLVVQHQAQLNLRAENDSLKQQMVQLQTDNASLSNRLASPVAPALSAAQYQELLKLRGEVGGLRKQSAEAANLRAENQRLRVAANAAAPADAQTPEEQQRAMAMAKLNDSRQGVLAMIMFANDYQRQFPTNFSQMAPYLNTNLDQVATNFDIVFQGTIDSVPNPAQTIVLREKQAWQAANGNWLKTYGFADGHAEVHSEPSGNFDAWESQRIVPPPAQ